jgi:hypothetical protein
MTSIPQVLLLASASAFMLLVPRVASATLPPTISTQFVGPPSIPLRVPVNRSFGIIFILKNPNASSLTGVGFTETLPSGLVILNPNGVGGCGGGTITAVPGTSTIGLAGAILAGDSVCLFGVNVASTTGGTKTNTTGPVTSNEGGTEKALRCFEVDLHPRSRRLRRPQSPSTWTSLTFTIQNPNAAVDLDRVHGLITLGAERLDTERPHGKLWRRHDYERVFLHNVDECNACWTWLLQLRCECHGHGHRY